jgi:TonB-dependent starch-binding outer membrane protein SusC
LKYRLNAGFNYAQQHSAQFQPADVPGQVSFFRASQGNIASVDNGETWGYTVENLLTYDKVIKDDHRINFTGLYSVQENQSFNNYVQKDSIADNFVQFYNLALSTPVSSNNTTLAGGESKWALVSYMGRLNYAFQDKYLATVTFRRDGSSRLSEGNQYFNYWAGSLGWSIADEKFMSKFDYLNALKLRLSYGTTSNQAVNPYQSLGLVNNSNGIGGNAGIIRYNFGPTIVSGYNVITLPNPELSWEFTNVLNAGLDYGFLKNRISGSVEAYWSKTNGILYGINLPITSGVLGSYVTNIGEMENKGMEFTMSSVIVEPVKKDGFSFQADLNLFFNRNKLLKLNGNVLEQPGNQLFVGHSMTAIWDYKKLGIWQANEAAEAAKYNSSPGQIKLEDRAGGPDGKPDGRITVADKYVWGNQDAKLQGGLTLRFGYKGFDLSTVLYARFGGYLVSQIHQPFASYLTIFDGRRNTLKVDYWTPTNPSNWFPMPQAQVSPVSDAWPTLGYYSGTFAKVRSINLGYNFDQGLVRRIRAQSVRLYFTVDNVGVLFSPYYNQTGIDPEGTGTGSQGVSNPGNIRGGQNGAITLGLGTPPRRTFTFGANINL